jgi:hypothetical protein
MHYLIIFIAQISFSYEKYGTYEMLSSSICSLYYLSKNSQTQTKWTVGLQVADKNIFIGFPLKTLSNKISRTSGKHFNALSFVQ